MENKKTAEARRPWYTKVVKSRKDIGERIVIFKITPGAGENSRPVEAEPAIKAFYPDAKIEVCHGSGECCKCNRYGRECEGIAHIPPNMEPCAEHRS